MKEIIYRLGDYKIIESDTGTLHWEAHSGVGMLKEGMCFLKGDILFIGPAENQKQGFLKLEFIESFKSAEFWAKTRFFCINAKIFYCLNGKKVSREEKLHWRFEKSKVEKTDKKSLDLYVSDAAEETQDGSFRLQNHMITKMQDGNFVWSLHAGGRIIKSGPCFLLEDILFLCPAKNRKGGLSRKHFIADLHQFPEWWQTKYYSMDCILHECEIIKQVKDVKKSLTDFLKIKVSEKKEDIKDYVPASFINPYKDSKACKSKSRKIQWSLKNKIKKILTVILFVLLILLFLIFLLISRRDHRERSHYKKDEYSRRTYKKH